MTYQDKKTLVQQAARLTTLGVELERRRGRVAKLVNKGYPTSSPKVKQAFHEFQKIDNQWNRLEEEHLALRRKLLNGELH